MNVEMIRARMRELGLSISKLADKSDLSESTIKRALGGANLSTATMELLAQALEMDLNQLITIDEPCSEPTEPPTDPNEPTEPIDEPIKLNEPEDATMRMAIEAIERAYEIRIQELKESKRENTQTKDDTIRLLTKLVIIIGVVLLVVISAIIAYFVWDFSHPNIGIIQY